MNRYVQNASVLVLGVATLSAHASNLMQVYRQALKCDPLFAQAESTWHSQKMNLPIAEAGYLPQVSINASTNRTYQLITPNLAGASSIPNTGGSAFSTGSSSYSWQYGYSLSATQPIFNFATWEQIKGAGHSVKAATATYLAAQQSLMQRTATAYFNVLQAYDQLRYTIANKRAVWEQFTTAREQFRVGLIAATDEYDARSRYDQVVAQQIAAQNNLNIQIEALRAITGREYRSLSGLGKHLPLAIPRPNNIDTWVSIANKQNYQLIAQNYTVLASMDKIKQVAGGDYPTLGLQGGVGESHQVASSSDFTQDSANLGLRLAYNPIQGGLVNASTKQARYDYVTASGSLEQTHRSVVNQARSSFLSVLSDVSKIKADKQSIISSRHSLAAREAGLKVGTRTMVDVLNALTALYQAEQQHANDQYAYINDLVALKAAAGTLSVNDLAAINKWLGKSIVFPVQTSVGKMPVDSDIQHERIKVDNSMTPPKPTVKIEEVTPIAPAATTSTPIQTPAPAVQLAPPKVTMLPRPKET